VRDDNHHHTFAGEFAHHLEHLAHHLGSKRARRLILLPATLDPLISSGDPLTGRRRCNFAAERRVPITAFGIYDRILLGVAHARQLLNWRCESSIVLWITCCLSAE
jgi:hypothetical protein